MSQEKEKCEFCNGELVTVRGELICTNCGLINKSALENKERYVKPTFYQERKLRQERATKDHRNVLKQINSDIAYIINYVELPVAIHKEAYNNALELLKKERQVFPKFPWNTKTPRWNYSCFIVLIVIVAIEKISGKFTQEDKLLEFFRTRGDEITLNDIRSFIERLTQDYEFIIKGLV